MYEAEAIRNKICQYKLRMAEPNVVMERDVSLAYSNIRPLYRFGRWLILKDSGKDERNAPGRRDRGLIGRKEMRKGFVLTG